MQVTYRNSDLDLLDLPSVSLLQPTSRAVSGVALFTYYKVDAAAAETLALATRKMQAELMARYPGLQARLWIRTDALGTQQTWMETYEHPRGVTRTLSLAIEESGQALPPGRVGERHTESFVGA